MRPAPAIDGHGALSSRASDLARPSSGPSGPHSAASSLGVGGGDVDLAAHAGAAPQSAATSSAATSHVAHGGPGLEAGGHGDHRDALGAGGLGQRPPVVSATRRAPRAPAASKQASVSSVLPE